jgi:hypothetical protein
MGRALSLLATAAWTATLAAAWTATLAAAWTATLAATLTAAFAATLVAADGRGALLHPATGGRHRIFLHLAAIFVFRAAL